MGTRSLTLVSTADGRTFLNMYRQSDGYPSCHGAALAKFLSGMEIINGISSQRAGEAANGAGCLAAQMVASFKTKIGLIYIYPADATGCDQDYTYHVTVTEKHWDNDAEPGIAVKVVSFKGETLFEGDVEAFSKFCSEE